MRLARVTEKDVDRTNDVLKAVEMATEKQRFSWTDPQDNWTELDDDDEDKILILKLRKGISEEDGIDEEDVDNRILMWAYIKDKFSYASARYNRVIFGMWAILEDLDITKSYMDFHPGYQFNHVANEQ